MRAPRPSELAVDALECIDHGNRAWTYYAESDHTAASIKVISSATGAIEEAEVTRLRHPCIPRTLSVGLAWGRYYIVREWVDGETFHDLVNKPVQVAMQVAGIAPKRPCHDEAR